MKCFIFALCLCAFVPEKVVADDRLTGMHVNLAYNIALSELSLGGSAGDGTLSFAAGYDLKSRSQALAYGLTYRWSVTGKWYMAFRATTSERPFTFSGAAATTQGSAQAQLFVGRNYTAGLEIGRRLEWTVGHGQSLWYGYLGAGLVAFEGSGIAQAWDQQTRSTVFERGWLGGWYAEVGLLRCRQVCWMAMYRHHTYPSYSESYTDALGQAEFTTSLDHQELWLGLEIPLRKPAPEPVARSQGKRFVTNEDRRVIATF